MKRYANEICEHIDVIVSSANNGTSVLNCQNLTVGTSLQFIVQIFLFKPQISLQIIPENLANETAIKTFIEQHYLNRKCLKVNGTLETSLKG